MIVLDANILIRTILGRRVRMLLEEHTARGLQFLAPDAAFIDAHKYLPSLLLKRGKPDTDLPSALRYLQTLVKGVDLDVYGPLEAEAKQRLQGRDEEDWPVLAAALAFNCAIWDRRYRLLWNWSCHMDNKPDRDFLRSKIDASMREIE